MNDLDGMRAALDWSARGRGWTSPRPSVGCVLVKDGQIIGGGHTQPGHGNPHAEVMALQTARAAGHDMRGATAYVTLEPCCHWATTPPCTDALIEAGIARVVCGVEDPNPAVHGRGYAQLRAAGVEVVTDFLWEECFRAQDDFLKFIATQTPFVTLKSALSLDGKTALLSGESQWITGDVARRRAHQLRHEHDAVLVGIGTVLADDPQLNVRLEGEWKQPVRVVLDTGGRLPLNARLLHDTAAKPVLVAVDERLPDDRVRALEVAGATLLPLPCHAGRLDLDRLTASLWERGICSLLIEGGATVAGAALTAGIVDKIVFFLAPLLIGKGRDALGDFELSRLAEAPRLHAVQYELCGEDIMVSGYMRGMSLEP